MGRAVNGRIFHLARVFYLKCPPTLQDLSFQGQVLCENFLFFSFFFLVLYCRNLNLDTSHFILYNRVQTNIFFTFRTVVFLYRHILRREHITKYETRLSYYCLKVDFHCRVKLSGQVEVPENFQSI